MSLLTVQPVRSRRDGKLLAEFPWRLYRDDPLWIPPLRRDQEELLGLRPHPFYASNEIQNFLAFRDGEVCGRIAAIHNRTHNEFHQEQRGFFGFFECRDDPEAAHALLDAARQWLAERGLHRVRGPVSPSTNYVTGFLVDGFDSSPTFLLPYNPPYYASLVESYGFRKTQDLYAYWGNLEMLPAIQKRTEPMAQQIVERFGLRLRTLDRKRFRQDVEEFLSVFNRSATRHWGFVPLSPAEVEHLAKGLSWLLVPDMTAAIEMDGRTVAVALALPDYNPCIRRINGRLFPFGFLRLLAAKRKVKKYRFLTTNVLPEYQIQGLGLVLLRSMVPAGLARGINEAEFSWVAESNAFSRGALEKGGAKRVKTFRVFDLEP